MAKPQDGIERNERGNWTWRGLEFEMLWDDIERLRAMKWMANQIEQLREKNNEAWTYAWRMRVFLEQYGAVIVHSKDHELLEEMLTAAAKRWIENSGLAKAEPANIKAIRSRLHRWKELAVDEETDPMGQMIKDIEALLRRVSE